MRSRWNTQQPQDDDVNVTNKNHAKKLFPPRKRKRSPTLITHSSWWFPTILVLLLLLLIVAVGGFLLTVMMVPRKDDASLFHDNDEIFHTSSSSFIRRRPNNNEHHPSTCLDYGCVRTPPDYDEEILIAPDEKIKHPSNHHHHNNNNPTKNTTTNNNNIVMMTRQSNRHNPPKNQDAAIYISPFYATTTTPTTSDYPPPMTNQQQDHHDNDNDNDAPPPQYDFLMGIFDGHGKEGHIVAQYVAHEFPRILSHKLGSSSSSRNSSSSPTSEETRIIQVLKESFVEVDISAPPNAMLGGCTASVTLRYQNTLYFANAGDSRTILVSSSSSSGTTTTNNHNNHNNDIQPPQPHLQHPPPPPPPNVNITYMTRLDKAHLPDERHRIEALGGTIHIPPQNPQGSRVIVYSNADKVIHEQIGLAMSRSIGDWEWKAVGVIAEPLVDVLHIPSPSPPPPSSLELDSSSSSSVSKLVVMAASDGLWDTRPRPLFWAKQIMNDYYFGESTTTTTTTPTTALAMSRKIIDQASPSNPKFYRDDITFMAIEIEMN